MPAETRLRATIARVLGLPFEAVTIVTWFYGQNPVISVPSDYRARLARIGFNVAHTEG